MKNTNPSKQSTTSGKPDHGAGLTLHLEGQLTVEIDVSLSRGARHPARGSRSIEDEVFSGLLAQLTRVSEQYGGIPSHKVLDATTEILRILLEKGKIPQSLDDRFIARLIALIESIDKRTDGEAPYLRAMAAGLRAMFLCEQANGDEAGDGDDETVDEDGDDETVDEDGDDEAADEDGDEDEDGDDEDSSDL